MRQSTMESTKGRRGVPPPEFVPRMPGSVVLDDGRDMLRRGTSLDLVVVDGCDWVGGRGEGVDSTGPAIEAYIESEWMCVPGPGRYLFAGPRTWPGRASWGRDMVRGGEI